MKLRKIPLEIGLERPLKLLHLSDTHLCYADERDDERKRELARSRGAFFEEFPGETRQRFEAAIEYARTSCDLLVHTGDLIDFVSKPNLEALGKYLAATDSFFAVGNHEFSLYVGEAWEDEAYKMQSFAKVEKQVGKPIDFVSRQINGLNLVAIDNSYYLFAERHLELLRQEVARGLPVLLLIHNPIHTDELYDEMRIQRKHGCAWLVGTPDEKLQTYSEAHRRQQQPDDATMALIEFVKKEPAIKAVLTGHLHFSFETLIDKRIPQYITGGGFDDFATEFEIC